VSLLRSWPDPVLGRPCAEVPGGADLVALRDSLHRAMVAHHGVGLAANQIGVDARAFVALDGSELLFVANPHLVDAGGYQLDVEGCLSVPDRSCEVSRPAWVSLDGLDATGVRRTWRIEGYTARIVCHELDHLDGHTILAPHLVAVA